MPLNKIEHEQIAAAIHRMEARDDPSRTGSFDYISRSDVLFLITRYTQEFYDEHQEGDVSDTHGGTD
jgi:hypothetical protein